MDSLKLNEVQLIPVVGQMLLSGKTGELGKMAAGDSRVLRLLHETLAGGVGPDEKQDRDMESRSFQPVKQLSISWP